MPHEILRRLRRPVGPLGRRIRVDWAGELRFLRVRRPCRVLDVSSSGAHVQIDGLPSAIRQVWLVLDQGPPIAASLVWRERNRIGLSFHGEQEWLAEMGRRRLDSAAWVR
jgi:hypothetical protein